MEDPGDSAPELGSWRRRGWTAFSAAGDAARDGPVTSFLPRMRIAVAGTHRNGKTSLTEAFVRARPDFDLEPEPYEQMLEAGEDFLDHYEPEAFTRQLEHLVGRLTLREPGEKVIFDRSPMDFLAYLAACDRTDGWSSIESDVIRTASTGLAHLDLVVWLPLRSRSGPATSSLRRVVDAHLADLIGSDPIGVLGQGGPRIVEVHGSTPRRLKALLRWVSEL